MQRGKYQCFSRLHSINSFFFSLFYDERSKFIGKNRPSKVPTLEGYITCLILLNVSHRGTHKESQTWRFEKSIMLWIRAQSITNVILLPTFSWYCINQALMKYFYFIFCKDLIYFKNWLWYSRNFYKNYLLLLRKGCYYCFLYCCSLNCLKEDIKSSNLEVSIIHSFFTFFCIWKLVPGKFYLHS